MANYLFNSARKGFLTGAYNWDTGTSDVYRVLLVKAASVSGINDDKDTISSIGNNATSYFGTDNGTTNPYQGVQILNPVATVDGAADGNDITFQSVTSGEQFAALLIYKENSPIESSELIAYIDSASGLPITGNGGDIIVTWDEGINKIFRL